MDVLQTPQVDFKPIATIMETTTTMQPLPLIPIPSTFQIGAPTNLIREDRPISLKKAAMRSFPSLHGRLSGHAELKLTGDNRKNNQANESSLKDSSQMKIDDDVLGQRLFTTKICPAQTGSPFLKFASTELKIIPSVTIYPAIEITQRTAPVMQEPSTSPIKINSRAGAFKGGII